MTNEEVKKALIKHLPVRVIDHQYTCNNMYIKAIVYRAPAGKIVTSAEISDEKSNSTLICYFDQIELE